MKKLFFLLLFIPIQLLSQQYEQWVKQFDDPISSIDKLKSENAISEFLMYDFSDLLIPNSEFLGYTGEEYQRIYMTFNSIEKREPYSLKYFIEGYSIVHNNKCDFTGSLVFTQVREFEQMYFGVDNEFENAGIKLQGIAFGRYSFKENPDQNHVGVFEGNMALWWYVDKEGKIQIDDIRKHLISFRNNQYCGIWTEYGKSKSKPCNWGEHRIPIARDLDIGIEKFSANPKYKKQGW